MKSNRVMKIFEQYIKKYDMNNINIKTKYFHSLKVMEIARDIATKLGIFTEEEIAVCEFLGLFHEIGSFSKTPNYHIEDTSVDSYEKTIDILFNKKLIREVTKETTYDDIIKIALYSYNKEGYPKDIDEKTKHICAILKDAHHLDSFRMFINCPFINNRIESYPNNLVYEEFKKFNIINEPLGDNTPDNVLVVLSNMYSFNYKYTYTLLKENMYVNKIFNSLNFANDDVMNFFRQLAIILNNYIDKRIGA